MRHRGLHCPGIGIARTQLYGALRSNFCFRQAARNKQDFRLQRQCTCFAAGNFPSLLGACHGAVALSQIQLRLRAEQQHVEARDNRQAVRRKFIQQRLELTLLIKRLRVFRGDLAAVNTQLFRIRKYPLNACRVTVAQLHLPQQQ